MYVCQIYLNLESGKVIGYLFPSSSGTLFFFETSKWLDYFGNNLKDASGRGVVDSVIFQSYFLII